ncbi:VOC family protein [Deinococcus rubellus]|uniref:VOC family protein n=1 Tax=Deinococcus rubellus TaxID=1889240 RepID=A0ABY5YFX7_9DEIO|nr:VOC family protein [Deinococcus rubellus]UWX62738.1 VOC family protein [Deinococcus rubellus]
MDWKLEVVVVPVTDIDRALSFYAEQLGFKLDHDIKVGPSRRIVQLTPRGSGCSIVLGAGQAMTPGSLHGLQLTVSDVRAARAELLDHQVEVGEIQVMGSAAPRPAEPEEDLNYVGFLFFKDPDGNSWAVQQINHRPVAPK